LDFCLRLADGSYWRFHPGGTRKSSAKPRFFPAEIRDTATTTARGAAEHGWMQWTTASDSGIFSLARTELVPQSDKLGKHQIWLCVQRLLNANEIPSLPNALDITDGEQVRWWLWVCNLGFHTRDVIGSGIDAAQVSHTGFEKVLFTFRRIDGTSAEVELGMERSSFGSMLRVRRCE
jgi:hypothetical protein